jgi:uncharacterized protein
MHIVDLPDAAAAQAFAYEEPCYVAGVYAEVMVRRWRNDLGRTMWEFEGGAEASPRFLVIGHGGPGGADAADPSVRTAQRRYFFDGDHLEHTIARGPLLSDDGREWVGDAMLLELRDRAAVEAMLAWAPFARAGLYADVEIHDWEFGGRR